MAAPRRIIARNSASASGNPLHDRERAQALGYKDAIISGADTFTYLTYLPVQRWGMAWFEGGALDCTLLKPVFDGELCEMAADSDGEADFTAGLRVDGELRATAWCSLSPRTAIPSPDDIPWCAPVSERMPLTEERLKIDTVLPTIEDRSSLDLRSAFVAQADDDLPVYADGQLLHSGYLINLAMHVLGSNFLTDAMIHVGSCLRSHLPIRRTAELQARARVLANYETRGHKAVLLNINIVADGAVSASIRHAIIHRLRER